MTTSTEGVDIELGVVGISEGNGHPYSFASIVNGYEPEAFITAGWKVILDYLEEHDSSEFGFEGVGVTHAWTQDEGETKRLCAAARIPNRADDLEELVGLDGVLLLRDDYENHLEMAWPFLKTGTPVFVDKPLSLAPTDLSKLTSYLRSGQLMSCSGLRYARELEGFRGELSSYGSLRLVRGTVLFGLAKYGIHVLEPILGAVNTRPTAVRALPADHDSVVIETDAGYPIQIDALGEAPPLFEVDVYGTERSTHHDLTDNFHAFRRTLYQFIKGIRTGEPSIEPEETLDIMRVLIASNRSQRNERRVLLSELNV